MKTRKKKEKEKEKILWLLNPKHLQQQIDEYGYYFSMGNYLVSLMVSLAGVVTCGRVFSLHWYFTIPVIALWMVLLPGMILDGYKNMYEHKKFLEAADYMEQVLYSFKVQGKILAALRDTGSLFSAGRMKTVINQTVAYIEKGVYEKDLYQEALAQIEMEYPGRRISMIHNFLRLVEKNGGDCSSGIQLLLEDKALWVENVLLLQQDKKRGRIRVIMALVITMVLAAVFHGVYRSMPETYSIIYHPVTQIGTACYLILNILIFRKANRELAGSWLERECDSDEKKVQYYWKIVTEEKQHQVWKKSMLWSVPFFLLAVICQVKGYFYITIVAVVIGVFMGNQHKMAYRISYNWIVKEINLRFPQWLMEMALLLQGNNVQVAVAKTVSGAPAVLKPELEKMVEQLKAQPEAAEPYMEFLEMFQLSYVQSAMKMLYAISESGSGDSQEQIRIMVRRNEKLLDQAEKIWNERKLAGINTIGYFPQITISFQMMINMVVFMMAFLTKMSI